MAITGVKGPLINTTRFLRLTFFVQEAVPIFMTRNRLRSECHGPELCTSLPVERRIVGSSWCSARALCCSLFHVFGHDFRGLKKIATECIVRIDMPQRTDGGKHIRAAGQQDKKEPRNLVGQYISTPTLAFFSWLFYVRSKR